MTGPTPRSWVRPLPPETLPGYAEAKAKVERGETLFPVRPKRAPLPRRTLASLQAEHDDLVTKRDRIAPPSLPDDPGALSGIRRRRGRADDRRDAATDRDLAKYTALTNRIDALAFKIARRA